MAHLFKSHFTSPFHGTSTEVEFHAWNATPIEMMDMWNATSKDEPWNDVVEMQQRRKCATAAEPLLAGKMGGAKGWLRWNWWWDHLFQNRFLWSLREFLESLRGIYRESQGVSEVLIEPLGIWVVLKGSREDLRGPRVGLNDFRTITKQIIQAYKHDYSMIILS